jgi:hypothetical protein
LTSREKPRVRASGHRPPDRSATPPTWRRTRSCHGLGPLSGFRTRLEFAHHLGLAHSGETRDDRQSPCSTSRAPSARGFAAPFLRRCARHVRLTSTCTELFNELRRRRPFSVLKRLTPRRSFGAFPPERLPV